MLHAAISTLLIIFAVPVVGLIVKAFNKALWNILARRIGSAATYVVMNYLTFVGVVHHEIAHGVYALLTGAKVTEFAPFKPQKSEDGGMSLGHVNYIPRGPWFLRSIQNYLSSMAPTIQGVVSLYFMRFLWALEMPFILRAVLAYFGISILVHMDMSPADVKIMAKGLPVCMCLIFVVCWIFKVDLLGLMGGGTGAESPSVLVPAS